MDDAGRKKLWEEYMRTRSPELREKIIERKKKRLEGYKR